MNESFASFAANKGEKGKHQGIISLGMLMLY
jgi:hypothetical protein